MQFIGYTETHDYLLRKGSGDHASLSAAMSVRVKIGRNDEAPVLDLASGTATANGSLLSIITRSPARLRLRLAADDLSDVAAGIYDLETDVVMSGDVFVSQVGVFSLLDGL